MSEPDLLDSTLVRHKAERNRDVFDLIQALDAIVWEMDVTNWRFTFVSEQAEKLLGYPIERWLEEDGFWSNVILHPDDKTWAVAFCASSTERSEDHQFDYRAQAADGRTVWLRDLVRVIDDETGRPALLRGVMVDVTDQKLAEAEATAALEELRQREQALAEAQRLAHLGSWEWDLATHRVTWSDETYRIFGLEPGSAEVDFASYLEYLHPDDRELVQSEVQRAVEEQRSFAFEHRLVRPDGEVRTLFARGRMVLDAEGRPVKMIGTGHDVTEAKEAERQEIELAREQVARSLAETERERLSRLLVEAPAAVAITRGPEHVFEIANQQILELVGSRDLIGKSYAEGVPERLHGFLELLDRVYATGETFHGRSVPALVERGRGEPEEAWFNFVYQPVFEADGEVSGIFIHAVDITDEVLARQEVEAKAAELEALTQKLEKSNRDLDQFAYIASHDLKAPLRGIANLSQWLEEDLGDGLSVDAREMMDLLRGRVARMEALIEGILHYSRAGRAEVDPEPIDLAELVAETVEMIDPPEGFTIETGELPTLVSPRAPLAQVLLNLIGNAVKHTRRDDPQVRIEAQEEDGFLHVQVADNGPGIDPRYHDRVWSMFQTLEARDDVESTGIGLSVVHKLVEAAGGRVWIESDPDERPGATFHFTWPMAG